jgi:hypothetical protein
LLPASCLFHASAYCTPLKKEAPCFSERYFQQTTRHYTFLVLIMITDVSGTLQYRDIDFWIELFLFNIKVCRMLWSIIS